MEPSYRGHRFPAEIISHGVWLYHRFTLSFRDVEDLLAERGIIVSYEAIRFWCLKFGPKWGHRTKRKKSYAKPPAAACEPCRVGWFSCGSFLEAVGEPASYPGSGEPVRKVCRVVVKFRSLIAPY